MRPGIIDPDHRQAGLLDRVRVVIFDSVGVLDDELTARRSVPQDPQALRVALSHVAPAVDPAAGGEERFAAAEDGTAR